MLVSQGLANLQLTDVERQAVLDAINRDAARPAPGVPSAAPALSR
jgi:hypothetical protein